MFVQDDEKRLLYFQNIQKIKYKKLACFDLDHTFITTKSGSTFPKYSGDWNYIMIMLKIKLSNY